MANKKAITKKNPFAKKPGVPYGKKKSTPKFVSSIKSKKIKKTPK